MAEFLKLFIVFIISFNAILFLGIIIRKKTVGNTTPWKEIFYSLTVGWFSVSILIALFYSKLHTHLLIPVVLFILYWFFVENSMKKPLRTSSLMLKHFLIINLIAISFFIINWILICGFNLERVYYPTADMAYYTRLSDFLVNTGIESGTLDYFYTSARKTFPYHYIEHWFTGGVSKISGLATAHLYTLLYIPLMLVSLYFGFISMFKKPNTRFNYEYLLAFLALFISGFAFIYPNYIDALHVYIHDWSVLKYFKLLPVYLLILIAIFELEQRNYSFAIVLIVFSGLTYGTTLPAAASISGGLILLFYIESLWRKDKQHKRLRPPIVFLLLGLIGFGAYYIFSQSQGDSNSHFAELASTNLRLYIFTGINIILKISFAIIIVLLPYTLFILYWVKKESLNFQEGVEKFKPFLLMLLACLLAVIPYAAIHSIPNAHQLYRSMYFVCGNLGAIWLISIAYKSTFRQVRIVSIILIGVNSIIHFEYRPAGEAAFIDKSQFLSIKSDLSDQNGKVMYFRHIPNNQRYYSAETEVYIPSNYLQLLFSPLQIACANPEVILSEPISDFQDALLNHVEASPINRLHEELYGLKIYEQKNDSIYLNFIEKFEINGVIAPVGYGLPQIINKQVTSSLDLKDGNFYYKLR